MLTVNNSSIRNGGHIIIRAGLSGSQWLWLKRAHVKQEGYSLVSCENSGDIFLEDYFCDVDNPTDIELSLLELEHGITYLKDE